MSSAATDKVLGLRKGFSTTEEPGRAGKICSDEFCASKRDYEAPTTYSFHQALMESGASGHRRLLLTPSARAALIPSGEEGGKSVIH